MPKLRIRLKLDGSLKTRSDEREFTRLLEEILATDVTQLVSQFDGNLRLERIEVGPIKSDGDPDD